MRFLTPNNKQRELNVIKTSNAFVSGGFVLEMHPTEFSTERVRNGENQSPSAGRERGPTTGMHFVAYSNLQRQIVDNGK